MVSDFPVFSPASSPKADSTGKEFIPQSRSKKPVEINNNRTTDMGALIKEYSDR